VSKADRCVVKDIVTYRTVDEDREVEVFVTECVVETEGEIGKRVTDNGTVVLVKNNIPRDSH
jgi:hypothetical protein